MQTKQNKIITEINKDFDLSHIFDCGQCFRWNKQEDGSYTGVVENKIINILQEDNKIIVDNINIDDYNDIFVRYFDIDTDYTDIKDKINVDDIINEAINFGYGIRILNQDEWEIMISFMISANNRIPMIKKVIENLSEQFGQFIGTYSGKDYYSFPTAKEILKHPVEKIKECKAGFRSERIREAAIRFESEQHIIYNIKNKTYEEGLEYLKTYKGIGDKVANCVLLFSMKQFNTFPVDVWVRRVMQELYVDKSFSDKEIKQFAENKFGNYSGYAQQYLFYYARENGIGK